MTLIGARGDSSLIFTFQVKAVSRYGFMLVLVVLHMTVKEISKSTLKNREIGHFILESQFQPTLKISSNVPLNLYQSFKQLIFRFNCVYSC